MNEIRSIPILEIAIGDIVLTASMARLISIRISSMLSQPVQCEVRLFPLESATKLSDRALLGNSFTITLRDSFVSLFEGEVTAIEFYRGPSQETEIRIRGYDLLHRLRRKRNVRRIEATDLQGLASKLIADSSVAISIEDDPDIRWQHIFQQGQTDLELLQDITERIGIFFSMNGKTLDFYTLKGFGEPVQLAYKTSLMEVTGEISIETAYQETTVKGWNSSDAESIEANDIRSITQLVEEFDILANQRSERSWHFPNMFLDTPGEAYAVAEAMLRRCDSRERVIHGIALGEPKLRAGSRIEIQGFSEQLDGAYTVSQAIHTISSEHGFITRFTTAPPKALGEQTGITMTIGIITDVVDPEQRGRVKAQLPSYNAVETEWLEVVCPGAGTNKGFVVAPGVGDTVAILLANRFSCHGLVLGGLYGLLKPPDDGVSDTHIGRMTWTSKTGHRIQLDDDSHGLTISAAGSLLLTAGRIVIRGSAVDFEKV